MMAFFTSARRPSLAVRRRLRLPLVVTVFTLSTRPRHDASSDAWSALRNAAEREQAGRRLTIRAAMVKALTMGAVDPVRVFEIVDRVLGDEIAAGRL